MLKLINAFDMPIKNVIDYYNTFKSSEDLNCYYIEEIKKGPQAYINLLTNTGEPLFYLIDDEYPNYIIGYGNFHHDTENTGNIGYGIRPTERNKGYGTALLSLLLLKCEEMGIHKIYISHLKDNEISQKIILYHNGELIKEFYDEESQKNGLKYQIKLNPPLEARLQRLLFKNQSIKFPN